MRKSESELEFEIDLKNNVLSCHRDGLRWLLCEIYNDLANKAIEYNIHNTAFASCHDNNEITPSDLLLCIANDTGGQLVNFFTDTLVELVVIGHVDIEANQIDDKVISRIALNYIDTFMRNHINFMIFHRNIALEVNENDDYEHDFLNLKYAESLSDLMSAISPYLDLVTDKITGVSDALKNIKDKTLLH